MSDVFRILDEGTAIPFRPAGQFADHWLFVVSDHEVQFPNYRVLVSPQASTEAIAAAARNRPREIGGVVVGRFLRDAEGPYTLVTNVVIAPDGSGDFGQLKLSPEMTTRLKEEAGRIYPTGDVVGWWHSHMSVSNYSSTDLETQRIWANPRHIGLLVFADAHRRSPDDSPWARVYVGPEAQPTDAYRRKTANAPNESLSADHATSEWGHLPAATQNASNRLAQRPAARPQPQAGWQVNTIRLTVAVLVVATVWLLGYGSYSVLHAPGSTETGVADAAGSVPNWSCIPVNGTTYRCRVARGSPNDFQWRAGGKTSFGEATNVDVSGGSATVQLYQTVNEQQILIGTMPLHLLRGFSRPNLSPSPVSGPSPTHGHHSERTPSSSSLSSPTDAPTERP